MLLTNIDVNKACTTERGNRYLPVVSYSTCANLQQVSYHNYNATNYMTSQSSSNSSVVKTAYFNPFFTVMSSNLRRVLFFYFSFINFLLLLLASFVS